MLRGAVFYISVSEVGLGLVEDVGVKMTNRGR